MYIIKSENFNYVSLAANNLYFYSLHFSNDGMKSELKLNFRLLYFAILCKNDIQTTNMEALDHIIINR